MPMQADCQLVAIRGATHIAGSGDHLVAHLTAGRQSRCKAGERRREVVPSGTPGSCARPPFPWPRSAARCPPSPTYPHRCRSGCETLGSETLARTAAVNVVVSAPGAIEQGVSADWECGHGGQSVASKVWTPRNRVSISQVVGVPNGVIKWWYR